MSKKGLLIFAVLAITTLILSACGGAAATPTPEPSTILLLGSGLIGFVGFRKRFRNE